MRSETRKPVESLVSAGIVAVACTVGERCGMARADMLHQVGLHERDLDDPGARLPAQALIDLVAHIVEQTEDRVLS